MLLGDRLGDRPAGDLRWPGRVASVDDRVCLVASVTRKRGYFLLMGLCLTLFVLAWTVVRTVSTTWAVIMSVAALLLPPIAAIVANAGDEQRPRR
jgi:hypothetical protein